MSPSARNSGKPVQLDDVSKKIIEQLQGDGRRSYAEIGKAVGLSEAAVRQRVQKLTDSGVMQVVAVTDPMQLGFYRQAMIGIRVAGDTTVVAERSKAPRRGWGWPPCGREPRRSEDGWWWDRVREAAARRYGRCCPARCG